MLLAHFANIFGQSCNPEDVDCGYSERRGCVVSVPVIRRTITLETNMREMETNMQELDKCLERSPNGLETELMLETFRRQMEMWELALPLVKPLVLDFGLGHSTALA